MTADGGGRADGPARAVLVVDDDSGVQRVAQRVLQRAGWRVLLADGGPAAIAMMRAGPHDVAVALVDLSMPEMSGEETVLALRGIVPTLAVVLASGYNEQRLTDAVALGPRTGFVQKPFGIEELVAAVQRVASA